MIEKMPVVVCLFFYLFSTLNFSCTLLIESNTERLSLMMLPSNSKISFFVPLSTFLDLIISPLPSMFTL